MGSIHNIFPTLLETAEVGYQGTIDGDNLAPLLKGGKIDKERDFLMHVPHSHRSSYYTVYRLGDWKLIYHYNKPEGERCELFNLAQDRIEESNLAKSNPKALQRMLKVMNKALEDAGAQYPVAAKESTKELTPVTP